MRRYDKVEVLQNEATGEYVILFTRDQDPSKNFSVTLPKDAAVSVAKMILADLVADHG